MNYCINWRVNSISSRVFFTPSIKLMGKTGYSTKVSTPHACWKCHSDTRDVLFCEHCNGIQSPMEGAKLELFDLFDIHRSYQINKSELSKRYRGLMVKVHPDKYAHPDRSQEREYSEDYSSHINKSYSTLINPYSRATYLLKTEHGIDLESVDTDQALNDSPFLEEMFDINMAIDMNNDDTEEMNTIKSKLDNMKSGIITNLEKSFAANDISQSIQGAKKLKYLKSITDRIHK